MLSLSPGNNQIILANLLSDTAVHKPVPKRVSSSRKGGA